MGGWGFKNPQCGPLFFKYFRQFKEKQWPSLFRHFHVALRLYNSYNHARAPDPHMSPSPGPGPDSKCSKTVEVRLSARVHHWWNSRKTHRERSNIKALVSVHWRTQCLAKWQSGCRQLNACRVIVDRFTASLRLAFTAKPWVRTDPPLKNGTLLVISCNLELIFCVQKLAAELSFSDSDCSN